MEKGMRWSRRIRHLPPTTIINLEKINMRKIKSNLREQKRIAPQIAKKLSEMIKKRKEWRSKLTANQQSVKNVHKEVKNTKLDVAEKGMKLRNSNITFIKKEDSEILTILDAPKVSVKKSKAAPNVTADEVKVQIRGSSCSRKLVLKKEKGLPKKIYMVTKRRLAKSSPKLTQSASDVGPLIKRKNYVLEVLNHGNVRDIEKLQSVGHKTAESIMLFRQFRGPFSEIGELSELPTWHEKRYKKFVTQNFLKDEII